MLLQLHEKPGARKLPEMYRLLTLAVAAEDHFRIYLQEDAQAPPQTLGEFAELVARRRREQAHAQPD